jgi:hypothetical protein
MKFVAALPVKNDGGVQQRFRAFPARQDGVAVDGQSALLGGGQHLYRCSPRRLGPCLVHRDGGPMDHIADEQLSARRHPGKVGVGLEH